MKEEKRRAGLGPGRGWRLERHLIGPIPGPGPAWPRPISKREAIEEQLLVEQLLVEQLSPPLAFPFSDFPLSSCPTPNLAPTRGCETVLGPFRIFKAEQF